MPNFFVQVEAVQIREEFEERGRKLEAEIRWDSILSMQYIAWNLSHIFSHLQYHLSIFCIYQLLVKPTITLLVKPTSEPSLRHEVRKRGKRLRKNSEIGATSREREVFSYTFCFLFSCLLFFWKFILASFFRGGAVHRHDQHGLRVGPAGHWERGVLRRVLLLHRGPGRGGEEEEEEARALCATELVDHQPAPATLNSEPASCAME